jgi:imidazolonepropionase-like amidohydrolase
MMFISCSTEQRLLSIPENGEAVIGGYWSPELEDSNGPALIQWKDGKINSIQPLDHREDAETGKENFNQWSHYLLKPGYIDTHVHLALDSIDFFKCLENWQTPSLIHDNMKVVLKYYLERGIVAIRDGGDLPGFSWLAKNEVARKNWVGPEIVSVHEAVSRTGLYGRFLGRGFENIPDWRDKENSFFKQGVDQLKIIVTGIIRFDQYGMVGPAQWSIDELKKLVESAHRRGISVMAHASGEEGITIAIEAGVDSIEHGYYMTTEQLLSMREKNIAWVPTVAPIGNLLKYPENRYSAHEIDVLKQILKTQLARINEAYQFKVRIGVGTDAGAYQVPHGKSFYDEIAWFKEAGIPTLIIDKMATEENARILNLSGYGRVEAGSFMQRLQLVNI